MNVGLNLSDVGNVATQWMLNDAFKQSSGWFVKEIEADFGEPVIFSEAGSYTISIDQPTDLGLNLTILESDSGDQIRNIRFILPGYADNYEEEPFTDEFIAFIEPFKTLRWMKPMSAEDQPEWI